MKPKSTLLCYLALVGSSILVVSSASAQTWNVTATGTHQWNTAGNWTGSVPNGIGAAANLSVNLAANQTVNLATGVTLGSLTFGDSASSFFAQSFTGSTITFNNNGSGATLTQAGASSLTTATGSFGNAFILNDSLTLVNNGTVNTNNTAVNLNGNITGTGGITINAGGGGGFALLGPANTYSGGLTLNATTAQIYTGGNSTAFGTGMLTINNGSIATSNSGAASQLLNTNNANAWNGNWNFVGFWNNNGNVTLGGNVTVTGSGGDTYLSLPRNIGQTTGGAKSLTFAGSSTTIYDLGGSNTYTGGTTVNSGTVHFLNKSAMANTGSISFATGSTFGVGLGGSDGWASAGTGAGTLAGLIGASGTGAGDASQAITYAGAVGLNLILSGSHTYSAIGNLGSGATALTVMGPGSLTITGDNTYTGATTLRGGASLVLDYTSSLPAVTKLSSGALTLGYATSTLTPGQGFGGGTITLKGGTNTETVNGTTMAGGHQLAGGGTFFVREGGTSKINLNAITRNVGTTLSFSDAGMATSDRNNFGTSGANGILGGWATVGNDWAVSANTGAADTPIAALNTYTPFVTTGGTATTNYGLSGGSTLTGALAANTLKITNSANSQALDLVANSLTITTTDQNNVGGLMYAGGHDNNYTITGTGRIVGSAFGAATNELIFAVQTGNLTVGVGIGPATGNSGSVTKTGEGRMIITSNNNFSGPLRINQGVVRLAHANASGATGTGSNSGTFVQNGAALELTGGLTFSADPVIISGNGISNGGALRSVSTGNTYAGPITTGIGGGRINSDTGLLTLTGATLTRASGGLTVGGVGNTAISGIISGGGGLTKDGAGTLTLTSTHTYSGDTNVTAGTLVVNGNISTSLVTVAAAGTLGGTGTVGGHTTISGTHSPGNSPGIITHGGNLTYNLGSNVIWELVANSTGSRGTNFDGINVGGTLDFIGLTTLGLNFNFGASAVEWQNAFWDTDRLGTAGWLVYSGATSLTNFSNLQLNLPASWIDESGDILASVRSGASFSLYKDGNNVYLNYVAVPEPRAALLGGIGTLLLLRRRR